MKSEKLYLGSPTTYEVYNVCVKTYR